MLHRYAFLVLALGPATVAHAWDTPTHSSPATAATVWTGVTVNWAPVINSAAYQLQVDTSASFDSPLSYQVTKTYINGNDGNNDTREALQDLRFGTTYHWRVRAYITGDTSAWSTPWTFITRDHVTQVAPTDGGSVWTGTTMDWYAHWNVDFYDAQLDTTPAFNSPVRRDLTTTYLDVNDGDTDTRWSVVDLFFGKTYYWRVRARNAVDTSSWTGPRTFITRDHVTQVAPTDGGAVWTGTTMDWYAHWNVDFYDAQLDTTPAFNSPVRRDLTTTYLDVNDGDTDTRWSVVDLFFGKTYYWRVRARNAVDTSSWTGPRTFITRDHVTQVAPTDGGSVWTGTTMDWYAHWNVDFYDAQLDTTPAFNSPVRRDLTTTYLDVNDGDTDTRWSVVDLFFGKTYYWRVRARNAVDTSSWTGPRTFITRDHVQLVSPTDGALNVSTGGTMLNWNAHWNVDLYQVQLDTVNLFNSALLTTVDDPYFNTNDGNSDTEQGTGALLADQWYFWRVRAINAVDTSAWTVRSFSTGSTPILLPAVPDLISPANGATVNDATPHLEWGPAANAMSYEWSYTTSPDLSSATSGFTTNTTIPTAVLSAGDTYYWRVRAWSGSNVSDWSNVWQFTYDQSTSIGEVGAAGPHVFPNPVADLAVVSTNGRIDRLRVFSMTGALQLELHPAATRVQLDMRAMPAGIYVVSIQGPSGDQLVRLVKCE